MIRSFFLAVAVATALSTTAQTTTDKPMVHDPVLAYENGTYYMFSTGRGINQMTSADLKSWTFTCKPLMKDIPAWTIAVGRPAKVVKEIPERSAPESPDASKE